MLIEKLNDANMANYKIDLNWDDIISNLHKGVNKPFYELIANAFDADAKKVSVMINYNDLGGVEQVEIVDDGDGVDEGVESKDKNLLENAVARKFKEKGFTSKKNSSGQKLNSKKGRELIGCKGVGRFQALSIGNDVLWETMNMKSNAYKIKLQPRRDIDVEKVEDTNSQQKQGTKITINSISKDIDLNDLFEDLKSRFALYIIKYDVTIDIISKINNESKIHTICKSDIEKSIILEDVDDFRKVYDKQLVRLKLIYWKEFSVNKIKDVFLCDINDINIDTIPQKLPKKISVHLNSTAFNLNCNFDTNELQDIISKAINKAYEFSNKITVDINREKLKEWKSSGIYPKQEYVNDDEFSTIESNLFDSIALLLDEHLKLKDGNTPAKKSRNLF
jgi:hypothetical protein